MAMVVLSNAQKDILKDDAGFRQQVKWAILNKAAYWKGLDGTSVPGGQTGTNLARWAKSRKFSAVIQNNPGMVESDDNVKQFLLNAKNLACVDNTQLPFSAANVVAWLLDDGSGSHINNFDSLADVWLDNQIATQPF